MENSRGRKYKSMTNYFCPLSKGRCRRKCSPMMEFAPKDIPKITDIYGNWVHLAQRESRYWGKQNLDPEEQHCCSWLMWKWHVFEDYLLYPLGLIRILQYMETLILFVLQGVPQKILIECCWNHGAQAKSPIAGTSCICNFLSSLSMNKQQGVPKNPKVRILEFNLPQWFS